MTITLPDWLYIGAPVKWRHADPPDGYYVYRIECHFLAERDALGEVVGMRMFVAVDIGQVPITADVSEVEQRVIRTAAGLLSPPSLVEQAACVEVRELTQVHTPIEWGPDDVNERARHRTA